MNDQVTAMAKAILAQTDKVAVVVMLVSPSGSIDSILCSDKWTDDAMRDVLTKGSRAVRDVISETARVQTQKKFN